MQASRADSPAGMVRLDWSATGPILVRWDVVGHSNAPIQRARKSIADPAIRDRTRQRAQEAPPIPTRPVATRNRRVVPGRIATLPDLQPDVPGPLAARQKENGRNRESRPAEFPHAIDRSLGDEFAPTICDRTILVPQTRRSRRAV